MIGTYVLSPEVLDAFIDLFSGGYVPTLLLSYHWEPFTNMIGGITC